MNWKRDLTGMPRALRARLSRMGLLPAQSSPGFADAAWAADARDGERRSRIAKAGVCLVLGLHLLVPRPGHGGTPPTFIEEDVLAAPWEWGVATPNQEQGNIAMALDGNGVPHIVFHAPPYAVYHGMRTGTGWQVEMLDSLPAGIVQSRGYGSRPRIAFDALGRAHVIYQHLRFRNGYSSVWKQIIYRRQTAPGFGVPWTAPEETRPEKGFEFIADDMSLGVSSDGSEAYLVTNVANSFPSVIYQHRVGGLWSAPFAPPFPYTASRQDLVVTPDGTPWLSSNTGQSTGDVAVGRLLAGSWSTEIAGDSDIATNPNGRLAVRGSTGDDLYMCFEVHPFVVGLRTRVNGEWHGLISGEAPGPIIPTHGELRMATSSSGWAPWILSARSTAPSGGVLLSASSLLDPEQWSTIPVTDTVSVDGSAWISVGLPNKVHVVYQAYDKPAGDPAGMRIRYALYDAPPPPPLAVEPISTAHLSLSVVPSMVRSGAPLQLSLRSSTGVPVMMSLYDVAGRTLRSRRENPGTTTWDVGTLEPGVYFLMARDGPASVVTRFVTLR